LSKFTRGKIINYRERPLDSCFLALRVFHWSPFWQLAIAARSLSRLGLSAPS
jgi:hypothetical protein